MKCSYFTNFAVILIDWRCFWRNSYSNNVFSKFVQKFEFLNQNFYGCGFLFRDLLYKVYYFCPQFSFILMNFYE